MSRRTITASDRPLPSRWYRAGRAGRAFGLLAATGSGLVGAAARGEQRLGTVEVEGDRPAGDATPTADDPPFVTVVPVAARGPGADRASVADAIAGEAGVHVRSRGGLGAFTSVSIRGSDPSEVAVYLDGVPLSRAASGALDLSTLPLDDLERIEIHRGVPPIELGGDAIGGVIHLVSRRPSRRPAWRASVGAGSFGARSATVGWGGLVDHRLHVDLSAAYHGATGDFLYYDNQGTLLDRSDDTYTRRRNNGFDQVAVDVTVGEGARDGEGWDVAAHGFWKRQGVPGFGSAGAETDRASLTTDRLLVDGSWRRRRGALDLRLALHGGVERTAFVNLAAERAGNYGASSVDADTLFAGADGRALLPIGTHQLASALVELRAERYAPHDLLDPSASQPPSSRLRAAVSAVDDIRLFADRLAVTAALRLDGVLNDLAPGQGTKATQAAGAQGGEAFLSPRLGARARATSWLALKGNVGRFVRFPTLTELFGDGAFVLPRPSLRPETSWGGDVGVELSLRRERASASLEAAFFGRDVSDYIALLPSARALAALNIGRASLAGLELRGRARLPLGLGLSVDYTYLNAINHTFDPGAEGHQLPGRARHELTARVDEALGPFGLFVEASYLSQVFRDPQNESPLPERWLMACGVRLGPFDHLLGASSRSPPLVFTVEVRNLLDTRVVALPLGGAIHQGETAPYPLVDVFDYPLPGRAIYATLALRS